MPLPYIVATDFDGTLCKDKFPKIGAPRLENIGYVLEKKRSGAKIILWTCREGELLQEAVEWCRGYGIEFDAVNENLPEAIEAYGTDPRKIGADEYLDDRARGVSGKDWPENLLRKVLSKEELEQADPETRLRYCRNFLGLWEFLDDTPTKRVVEATLVPDNPVFRYAIEKSDKYESLNNCIIRYAGMLRREYLDVIKEGLVSLKNKQTFNAGYQAGFAAAAAVTERNVLKQHVSTLSVSCYLLNALIHAGFERIEDLTQTNEEDFLSRYNLGKVTLKKTNDALEEYGLKVGCFKKGEK